MQQSPSPLNRDKALPRSVRRRIERVNQMQEQEPGDGGEAGESKPEPQDPAPGAAAPTSMPAPSAAPESLPSIQSLAPGFSYDPNDPRLRSENPRAAANDVDYWKQRFLVTSGFLERERTTWLGQKERLQADIDRLRSDLDAARSTAQPAGQAGAIDLKEILTPEQLKELDGYEPDQVKLLVTTAQSAAQKAVTQALARELAPIRERQQREQEDSEEAKATAFVDKLNELTPDWETINKRADWLAWLREPDDRSGEVRQQLLDRLAGKRDAHRIAGLFEAFRQSVVAAQAAVELPELRTSPPIAPSGNGRAGQGAPAPTGPVATKGRVRKAEWADYRKRIATKRQGQPGFVTDAERAEMEARMALGPLVD